MFTPAHRTTVWRICGDHRPEIWLSIILLPSIARLSADKLIDTVGTDVKHRSLRWILFLIRSFSQLNALITNTIRLDLDVFRQS